MSLNNPWDATSSNEALELALRAKVAQKVQTFGSMGELDALAVRIGLIQNSLTPRLYGPQLLLFAADHGLVADGLPKSSLPPRREYLQQLLQDQSPVAILARQQGIEWCIVDAGLSEVMPSHARLLPRKISAGSQNARLAQAMSVEQAHAALRAGMEMGDSLPGNVVACAAVGLGANESGALLLSRLGGVDLRELVLPATPTPEDLSYPRLVTRLSEALDRHRNVTKPIEVLAALGGPDIAMMVGVMIVIASKRGVIVADGLPAAAAFMLAQCISPTITEACIFTRSNSHPGMDVAPSLFKATAMLELGMESIDGTGATLAWPMLQSAAGLLTELHEQVI